MKSLIGCFLAFALSLGINAYAGIEDGLIIHFSFDEIDGNTVMNGSGLDINGTLEADAEQVTGYWGMGVALNPDLGEAGAGQDFVRVPGGPEVNLGEQFTIAVWVKGTNFGAYRTVMSNTDSAGFALSVENGVPTAWVHVNGDYLHPVGGTKLQKDTWYHLALTFDGKDGIIYLDGKEEVKGTRQGNVTISTSDFMIGAEPSGQAVDTSYPAWHGILDEFYLYNRALAEAEICLLIAAAQAVEPVGKLTTSWGRIKWDT